MTKTKKGLNLPNGYYNTQRVSRILGISASTINYWVKQKIIKPSISAPKGRGTRRHYDFVDMVQFKTVKRLREDGASLQKIKKVVDYLKRHFPEDEKILAHAVLISDAKGKTIYFRQANKTTWEDVLSGGQMVWSMIPIGNIVAELQDRMDELKAPTNATVHVGGKSFKVIIEEDLESGGFVVECPSLPGCVSQGETHKEALSMIKDAIKGVLDSKRSRKRNAA